MDQPIINRPLSLALIGLDTSHVKDFAKIFNAKRYKYRIKEARISVAVPAYSKKFSKSYQRVEKFTNFIRNEMKISIVDSIQDAMENYNIDGVILTSVDGREHLSQFKILSKYKKPVFIDKPWTCSYLDAKEMVKISKETKTPFFTTSLLRYYDNVRNIREIPETLIVRGPISFPPDFPGYFWYGIHIIEIFMKIFGHGINTIQVLHNNTYDTIIIRWKRGFNGVIIGSYLEGLKGWNLTYYDNKGEHFKIANNKPPSSFLLSKEIVRFIKERINPVDIKESLEIIKVLEEINKAIYEKNEDIIKIEL